MQVFCYLQQQNSKAHQFSTWPKKTSSLFTFPITNLKSFLPLDYMPASYHRYLLWLTRSICRSTCSCLYNQSWTASLLHTGTRSTTGCHTHSSFQEECDAIRHEKTHMQPCNKRLSQRRTSWSLSKVWGSAFSCPFSFKRAQIHILKCFLLH